jgi:hypothetical protein
LIFKKFIKKLIDLCVFNFFLNKEKGLLFIFIKKMSSTTLSREEYIAKAAEEFEKQRLAEEAEKRSRTEFASRVFSGARYPDTASLHQQGDFGGIYDSLEDHETNHLTLLRKQHGDSIHAIVMSPDKGTKDLGSFLLIFKPQSRVSVLEDIMDVRAPFSHTVVVPIEGLSGTRKEIGKAYGQRITDILSALPSDSPLIGRAFSDPSSSLPRDNGQWGMFFPNSKAHLGIYSHEGNFFFVSTSHAGTSAVGELETILRTPGMTLSTFVDDPRVRWIKEMSYRNCLRVVYHVASQLNLRIPHRLDTAAFPDPIMPSPKLAYPLLYNHWNTFGRDMCGNVICYRGCADPRQGTAGMLVGSNPCHGFIHFDSLKPQPTGIHFYPVRTSKIHKKHRCSLKPSLQKKVSKRVFYAREKKRCKTSFSREMYGRDTYSRTSAFFGLPAASVGEFTPAFVYLS